MPADDLDDDPLFARVRAARPVAPPSLAADVLRADRPRRRTAAIAGATLTCAAAAVCAVLILRHERPIEIGVGSRDAAPPGALVDAGLVATVQDGELPPMIIGDASLSASDALRTIDWTNIFWLISVLDNTYYKDIETCGGGGIAVSVERRGDGTASANHPLGVHPPQVPTPQERCRARLVERLPLPPMPARLQSVKFLLGAILPDDDAAPDWYNPVDELDRLLRYIAEDLRACTAASRTLIVVAEQGRTGTRLSLPIYQFVADRAGPTISDCMQRALDKTAPPAMEANLLELKIAVPITK